jgi:hydrogenase expression/formation protein HypC
MCLGVPRKIVEVFESSGMKMGKVDFGGVTKEACLAYVPEAKMGDYCIIHVGFSLSILNEAEATASLGTLREIAEMGKLSRANA